MRYATKDFFKRAMIVVVVLLTACSRGKQDAPPAFSSIPSTTVVTSSVSPAAALPNFVNLVKQQGQAVVNISTISVPAGMGQLRQGDPLYEFFRRFGVVPEFDTPPVAGLGSGFVISPDGYILTNAHVVADTKEVTVKLTNKREYKAKVIGIDPFTDVGLIKIDAKDLPMVAVGNPAMLENPAELACLVGSTKPDTTVNAEVWRKGSVMAIRIKVEELSG